MVESSSSWDAGVTLPQFPALTERLEVDVAIIGGGMTGLTLAYLLSQTGKKVAVLEKDRLGLGATGVTTAFITQLIDTDPADLISMVGQAKAKAVFASHAQAIDRLESIIMTETIGCEFTRCPNYIFAGTPQERRALTGFQDGANRLGVVVDTKPSNPLGFAHHGFVSLPNQAKFHPLRYLAGLVEKLSARGVRIFEKTEVDQITAGDSFGLSMTNGQKLSAHDVVVATHTPFDRALFFKKAFYYSYVMELTIPPNLLAEGIYENMKLPYHYFRVDRMGAHDRVIMGGEDHRHDIPVPAAKNFAALQAYAASLLNGIPYHVIRRWRGPIIESIDGLAYIGPHAHPHLFYATGFSGNGMTYSVLSAMIIADFIMGRKNQWAELYRPDRYPSLRRLIFKGMDYSQTLIGGALKNLFRS